MQRDGWIQRELGQLAKAGIVNRTLRDKQVYFKANENCPVFEELKSLMVQTAGVADVLRVNLAPSERQHHRGLRAWIGCPRETKQGSNVMKKDKISYRRRRCA